MCHCVPPAGTKVAQSHAATDLACPLESVTAYRAADGAYVARGCGRWAEYDCLSSGRGTIYAATMCAGRAQAVVHPDGESPP